MDPSLLPEIVASIPRGAWMSYGDVARAAGGEDVHARTLNGRFTRAEMPGAHRVLKSDGTVGGTALGDPAGFNGNGYMLLGLNISAIKQQYADESAQRGGPLMVVVTPTLPTGQGLSHACAAYGSSLLVLPDAKLDAVQLYASLCTQGDINEALLYATLSLVGTHAAVWTSRE